MLINAEWFDTFWIRVYIAGVRVCVRVCPSPTLVLEKCHQRDASKCI